MPKIKHNQISEEELKNLPKLPGVYLMKDEAGEVIYVGKAKNLKTRVRSYFNLSDTRASVKFILKRVHKIDTLVTENERQALVLESDLIGKYKPRYNIHLKDDKSHLLVRIDLEHEWPRLQLVRQAKDDGAKYVGPFAFSHEVKSLMEIINRTLPLRTCSDSVIYNRVRPCLEHQIKRCSAPCCLEVKKEDYKEWLHQAVRILEGKNKEVLQQLEKDMERASQEERFEDAALIRDRIEVLKGTWLEKPNVGYGSSSHDAIGVFRNDNEAEISVLRVRDGRLLESRTFGFSDVYITDEELLESFLSQYYNQNSDFPSEILLSVPINDREMREELYSSFWGRKVIFNLPKKGAKARLIKLANTNAEENYSSRTAKSNSRMQALVELRERLELEELPRTIECVDISHFQGGQTVGSVVHFKDGLPDKSRYRRFYLTQEGSPDDYASIKEVVTRHLSRAVEENTVCDLLVVDGGKGQLSQAMAVRKEHGFYGPQMVGLAKKRAINVPYKAIMGLGRNAVPHKPERVFLEDNPVPVVLDPSSDALHILEQIRNEAHRFAISFHRQARSKKAFRSALDLVQGIGPKRRMVLLKEFGSVDGIRKATVEELKDRAGLPEALAVKVLDALGEGEE